MKKKSKSGQVERGEERDRESMEIWLIITLALELELGPCEQ